MPRRTRSVTGQKQLFDTPRPTRRKVNAPKPNYPPRVVREPGKKHWLSATAIETWRRCPRCFWLQQNYKIYQPEGIVSRLANRFDGVIKKYFDLYRGTAELPPMVAGKVEGRLESPFKEKYFVTIDDKYGFLGKLDECLVRPDGTFTPVDHKTASSDPNQRELIPAYQFQLDSYSFLLRENRKPPSGIGHLIYFYPDDGEQLHDGFPMQVTVKTLTTNPDRVRPAIDEAIKVIEGPMPASAEECPFCKYIDRMKKF